MTDELSDESPMPFGKYGPAGKQATMEGVPATYLLWLWNHGLAKRVPISADFEEVKRVEINRTAVRDYIRKNMAALKEEAPDVIINEETE